MTYEWTMGNWSKYATFPCKQNTKIPATTRGFKDAQFNQDVLEFERQGYNVALALSMSGLMAFDLDYHDDNATPEADLESLEAELNSKLPRTLAQSTASGNGKHLIYSAKGITNPRGKIGKFCDVKYNGYIMIAPSVVNGKQYQILDGIDENGNFIIAELSQAWLNFLNKDTNSKTNQAQKTDFSSFDRKIYKNIDIERLFNNCAFLRYCRDNAEVLPEPEWFSMVGILAQIEDSDELIHSLSEPYPEYSYTETQKKIENARKFGHPQSCHYISANYPETCSYCDYVVKNKVV